MCYFFVYPEHDQFDSPLVCIFYHVLEALIVGNFGFCQGRYALLDIVTISCSQHADGANFAYVVTGQVVYEGRWWNWSERDWFKCLQKASIDCFEFGSSMPWWAAGGGGVRRPQSSLAYKVHFVHFRNNVIFFLPTASQCRVSYHGYFYIMLQLFDVSHNVDSRMSTVKSVPCLNRVLDVPKPIGCFISVVLQMIYDYTQSALVVSVWCWKHRGGGGWCISWWTFLFCVGHYINTHPEWFNFSIRWSSGHMSVCYAPGLHWASTGREGASNTEWPPQVCNSGDPHLTINWPSTEASRVRPGFIIVLGTGV